MNKNELAQMIDQTLLSATATADEVEKFCREAGTYGFASVCVNPVFVPLAHKVLEGTKTLVCTVIDFPLGAGGTQGKINQALETIESGADEIDFVIDLGLVKSHRWNELEDQLTEVTNAVRKSKKETVEKLILETCLLDDDEIVNSCKCAKKAGFDFVKTSTGFAIVKDKDGKLKPNGATVHAVELMRNTVGAEMGVKASGGVHNTQEALDMIKAGASRIGASAGKEIVDGFSE